MSEKKKFEIKSLDEALELLSTLEEYFSKLEKALSKWRSFKYGRKPYSYRYAGSGSIEDMIKGYIEQIIAERVLPAITGKVEVKISEEEVDKIVEKIREDLKKEEKTKESKLEKQS